MKFVILAPANAKSQDGVLPDDELVEAMPEFGEAFAQAGVLVAAEGLRPNSEGTCISWTAGEPIVIDGLRPYPAPNAVFDPIFPKDIRTYWTGSFVTDLPDSAIEQHVIHGAKVPEVSATMHLYPINGACHQVSAGDAAFAYRDATVAQVIVAAWQDPATTRTAPAGSATTTRPPRPTPSRAAAPTSWPTMTAAGCGTTAGRSTGGWPRSSAGMTWATYFHLNQNIPPST